VYRSSFPRSVYTTLLVLLSSVVPLHSQLTIVSPKEGATFSPPGLITIEATIAGHRALRTPIDVKVTASGPQGELLIAQGDLRSLESQDRISALWNISDVASGQYRITVAVSVPESSPVAVNVNVRRPPSVTMKLESLEPDGSGALATLSADAHSSDGQPITEYLWTPGDGKPTERTNTGRFTHKYDKRGTSYVLWLEVHDSAGGSVLLERDLSVPVNISEAVLQETNDCGCRSMQIRWTGGITGIFCADAVPSYPGCREEAHPPAGFCAAGQVAFICDLGPRNPTPAAPSFGLRFQVVARLLGNTNNLNACTEGQYARATFINDGVDSGTPATPAAPPLGPQHLPGGSGGAAGFPFDGVNPYPPYSPPGPVGPNGEPFGPDDYAGIRNVKKHTPGAVIWTDGPRNPTDGNASASTDADFVAFVRGNLGTCWCRFRLNQSWNPAAGVSGGITQEDGNNCAVEAPPAPHPPAPPPPPQDGGGGTVSVATLLTLVAIRISLNKYRRDRAVRRSTTT